MTHFNERILKIGVLFLGKTRDLANVFLKGFSYMGKKTVFNERLLKKTVDSRRQEKYRIPETSYKRSLAYEKKQHLKT